MRLPTAPCLLLASLLAAGAATAGPAPDGRWEGEARLPGTPLPLVLDLERSADGRWAGAVTLPGRGVQGAALDSVRLGDDGALQADLSRAFGGPPSPWPTRLALRAAADGRLEGVFEQGGHQAPLVLRRTGDAQRPAAAPPAPVPAALAGVWRGRYELGGQGREVTLTIDLPGPAGTAEGRLLIVGQRRTQLPVERIVAGARYLTLDTGPAGIRIEGRWDRAGGQIDGALVQGPFEAPLRLQRDAGSGS